MEKHDIRSREDVDKLINLFYEKVRNDALLAPVFMHVDWVHHTPVIVDFWSSLLLGDQSYKNNPFQKHINLAIGRIHFERWLALFHETLSENFIGEKADEAKDRSVGIAGIFQHKLNLI